jgi:hypothetical protein
MYICLVDWTLSIEYRGHGIVVGPFFIGTLRNGDTSRMFCLRDMKWQSNLHFEYPAAER